MRLLLDALRVLLKSALRFAGLVLALFALHLLLTRALPEVRRAAVLLDSKPQLAEQLRSFSVDLDRERRGAEELERRLNEAKRRHLDELGGSIASWQQRLDELAARKRAVEQQLGELSRERDEYCDTYNPFKLWFCREVDARTAEARKTLTPVVVEVERSLQQGQSALAEARRKLEALEHGDVVALGPEGAALVALDERIEHSRKRIQTLRAELENAERRSARLREVVQSPLGWLLVQWRAVGARLVAIAVMVLLLPYVQRTLWYFVLMPVCARARPLRLIAEPASDGSDAGLETHPAVRSLELSVDPGRVLSVRAGYARPVEGRASSQLFYRWRAPFISYSAGLVVLTRLEAPPSGEQPTRVTLASPTDPHSYLMRVDLRDHPGVVFHPRHLVGVMGPLELRTAWRIGSFHAWATGQLRYILLAGTGSLVLEGVGDIVPSSVEASRAKIEQDLVVGFDARLDYRTARTETFLPYLFGKTPLVDDVFVGTGFYFWQKGGSLERSSPVERTFDALFGAIGKLLGF